MFALLILAAAQVDQSSDIIVGGWDKRPSLTVAEGTAKDLAMLKVAAQGCGFSRIWVWDNSDKALLWVLAGEASRERRDCLDRWRTKHRAVRLNWQLDRSR